MELVLMHFNAQQGPIAFDAIPKAISKEIEAALIRLFDVSEGEGIEENFKWRWHRGKFQVARQIRRRGRDSDEEENFKWLVKSFLFV